MDINSTAQLDIEKEKKRNTRLAIGVAAIGVLFFALMYAVFFALMFLSPGFLFGMMPFPALSKEIVGVKDRLYVISKEVDMRSMSFENRKQPEERFTIGIFDNGKVINPKEIKRFKSIVRDDARIYFFDNGVYRTFDGDLWTETKTEAIGRNPKGVTGPDGIYVLSEIKNSPTLNLIKGDNIRPIELPPEFTGDKHRHFCSSQLIRFQDRLYLFWSSDNINYWAVYDGKNWASAELSDDRHGLKVIADDKGMYLFNEQFSERRRGLFLTVYENSAWTDPKELDLSGFFLDWQPVFYQGRLRLYVRNFFSEDLYTVENGRLINPVRMNKSFPEKGVVLKSIQLGVASNLIFFLLIYLLSIFVGKYKLRTWKLNSDEYEFASIFRRFAAHFIDTIIVILPPSIFIAAYLLKGRSPVMNPLKIIFAALVLTGYLVFANFLYRSLLEGFYGKTLGKKICGIVVLKDDFSRCTLTAGFLRNLMRVVDGLFYYLVAVVTAAGTLKWQRLGDIVAGTLVVRNKRS